MNSLQLKIELNEAYKDCRWIAIWNPKNKKRKCCFCDSQLIKERLPKIFKNGLTHLLGLMLGYRILTTYGLKKFTAA